MWKSSNNFDVELDAYMLENEPMHQYNILCSNGMFGVHTKFDLKLTPSTRVFASIYDTYYI